MKPFGTVAGSLLVSAYWTWALFSSSDASLVLERRIVLPPLGLGVPAVSFLVAAPLMALVLLARFRLLGWPLIVASSLNAYRVIKLQDPALSYVSAGLALAAVVLAAWAWLSSRPFRGKLASGRDVLIPAGLSSAVIVDAVLLLCFVPWSLRGDLPKNWNSYPFGPALRRVIFANLSNLDLGDSKARPRQPGLRLAGADLNGAKLRDAELRDANLFRARLNWADCRGADLRGAVLSDVRMSYSDFQGANLSGAEVSGNFAQGSDLRGACFRGARDHILRFIYSDCRGADFTSARLKGSTFFDSDCRGAIFRDADLTAAFLTRAKLDEADLSGANMSGADLRQASFRGADLTGAILGGVLLLGPEALAEARSLKGATLDPPLREALERIRPGLF